MEPEESENYLPINSYRFLWKAERRLYSVGKDLTLPVALTYGQLGWLAGGLILWTLPIFFIFSPPMSFFTLLILLGPPALLTWLAGQTFLYFKPFASHLFTMITFFLRPKWIYSLKKVRVPAVPQERTVQLPVIRIGN